ncbi:MAG: hypothetical protein K1X88_13080 [Nannocystaceae bacterium]|nr:hypothetical protein [Nannocystaceae bacterium]
MSNRRLVVAASLVLSSASGCGLLVRAAKGELTPVGVEALDGGGITQRGATLATATDAATAGAALRDLTSVYLYKCLEKPSRVPQQGNSSLREAAGETMVAALGRRVAEHPLAGDLSLDDEVASLRQQIDRKCGAAGLAKHDPKGHFAAAAELATSSGRRAYVERTAAALEPGLDAAIAADAYAVKRWIDGECTRALPTWDYCVPHVAETLWHSQRYELLFTALLDSSADQADGVLARLSQSVGEDKVVSSVKDYLLGGKATLPETTRALDRGVEFLRAHGAWGDCSARAPMWKRAITSGPSITAQWAIEGVVAERCRNLDDVIIKALGSDQPYVRAKAAWAVGELSLTKAKKHMERLQWSDPFLDQGCFCHPVRDEAKQAFNKLELGAG